MATGRSDEKVAAAELLEDLINESQGRVVPALVSARQAIEALILLRARQGKFNGGNAARDAVFREIREKYQELNAKLNTSTNREIRTGAKAWVSSAKQSIRAAGESAADVPSWTSFDKRFTREYFRRLNPYNAQYLAGVSPGASGATVVNGQITRMQSSDIRQLRATVSDVFREATTKGMTAKARQAELMSRFGKLIDDEGLNSWNFIDRAGRKWKPGNYFNMVNRTVAAQTQRNSYGDALIQSGRDTVQLVGPLQDNSAEACIAYRNRVFSLTGETPGLPTPEDYTSEGGFHPNCNHMFLYVSPRTSEGRALISRNTDKPLPKVKQPKPKATTTNSDQGAARATAEIKKEEA